MTRLIRPGIHSLCALSLAGWVCTAALPETSLRAAAPEQIPPLRPPREEIPPSTWEKHGRKIVWGATAFLVVAGGSAFFLTRPKPRPASPPEVVARAELQALSEKREDGQTLSQISQVVRRYLISAFGLPPGEYTTAEFASLTSANDQIGPGLAEESTQFLRTLDHTKFAPASSAPAGAVRSALVLIDKAEERRKALVPPAATGEVASS